MPKHLFVSKNHSGRQIAISDIHGCLKSFIALIDQLKLEKEDHLFLLGDYINRGPDSLGVIKHILKLQDTGHTIYCLRGNHEQMLLEILRKRPLQLNNFLKKYHSLNLLNKEGKLRLKVFEFLQECLYYIETDNHYLVHAGFDFQAENPLKAYHEMLNIRNFSPNYHQINKKIIIHGHERHSINEIKKRITKESMVLPIDNGCNVLKIKGQGNLLAIDLNSKELYIQKNIEK